MRILDVGACAGVRTIIIGSLSVNVYQGVWEAHLLVVVVDKMCQHHLKSGSILCSTISWVNSWNVRDYRLKSAFYRYFLVRDCSTTTSICFSVSSKYLLPMSLSNSNRARITVRAEACAPKLFEVASKITRVIHDLCLTPPR